MTGNATLGHMRSRQWEGRLIMIERRRFPATGCMTDRAVMVKSVCQMVRVLYAIKILLVTGVTVCRSIGITLIVTSNAIRGYMGSR